MKNESFLGREDIKEIFKKRLRGFKDGYRQNIAVLGDDLVGKSSVVLNYLSSFQDNIIVPIYMEIKDEAFPHFLKRFVCTMLYSFLQNSGISLKNDYEFLIQASERFIPLTVKRAAVLCEQAEKNRKRSGMFFELLDVLNTFHKETSKLCVVVLDEFQDLERFKIKNLYKEWGKLICIQKNVMYILVSSHRIRAQKILQEDLSLLFGNFEIAEVSPFDPYLSRELINNSFDPFFIEQNFRKFLIYFTYGHPFYLKTICDSIVRHAHLREKNFIDSEVFVEGLLSALSGEWSMLNKIFLGRTECIVERTSSRECLKILNLISDGFNRIKDIRLNLHQQKKKVLQEVNNLIAEDMVIKSGDFYALNDRLYSLWFRFVYTQTTSANPLMGDELYKRLKERIVQEIKNFIINNDKDILERMAELFYHFNDESVVIERKRLKLKHFREIKPIRFDSSHIQEGILGRSSDAVWITAFGKNDATLTDEGITEFARHCRKFRSKAQKTFIIVSEDIDVNARLMAKEEKIITWNLGNLNLLMDFYGKPRIIK